MNIKKFFITFGLVTVLLAGTFASVSAASPVHVTTFKAVYSAGSIRTTVGAADALNKPLSGAKVQISYEKEGVPIMLLNAATNAQGIAHFSGAVTKGKWLVCVEEINKPGFNYSPAKPLCTTITVP
jgi:hypothetical protein